jgi:hypothetical protein
MDQHRNYEVEPFDSLNCRREVEEFFNESRITRLEMISTLKSLTDTVNDVKKDLDSFRESTKDLVEVFNSLQGVTKVIIFVGKLLKPLAAITVFFATIHFYLNGLKIPKIVP